MQLSATGCKWNKRNCLLPILIASENDDAPTYSMMTSVCYTNWPRCLIRLSSTRRPHNWLLRLTVTQTDRSTHLKWASSSNCSSVKCSTKDDLLKSTSQWQMIGLHWVTRHTQTVAAVADDGTRALSTNHNSPPSLAGLWLVASTVGQVKLLQRRRHTSVGLPRVYDLQCFIVGYLMLTRNSSGDEIANVNFLYDDIVHAVKIQ